MSNTTFWTNVDTYLAHLPTLHTVDQVIAATNAAFPRDPDTAAGHGFFPGSGGDGTILEALLDSRHGWTLAECEANYYWTVCDRAGNRLEYIEGDLYAR